MWKRVCGPMAGMLMLVRVEVRRECWGRVVEGVVLAVEALGDGCRACSRAGGGYLYTCQFDTMRNQRSKESGGRKQTW